MREIGRGDRKQGIDRGHQGRKIGTEIKMQVKKNRKKEEKNSENWRNKVERQRGVR